jgi:hypothetical protein
MFLTTGDIAQRLNLPRSAVCYAIDRAGIRPSAKAGIVRLFAIDQWPDIVRAVRQIRPTASSVCGEPANG